ncbi:carboxylate-amine ligase [Herbiconiux sp. SYSU D00978]|uniref:carboxylate-amine ligase n=1 Tax=Herbiconiux sp. SYSU D00978 TaxID=2812562 RepID=UPI001A967D04|nr:glutamate--cysteine ligase [Herbiconiux sp. SYSU D00978]
MGAELTLGAEEELHLVDTGTLTLASRAAELLTQLPGESFCAELQRSTIETNTAPVRTLDELRRELLALRRRLVDVAEPLGLGVAAVGTVPRSTAKDFELTGEDRYRRLQELYRELVDEQLICGTQVHVGIADRDLAVEVAQRLEPDLPTFVALSAGSPFWQGHDTGYASFRTIVWQRWPTAGPMGQLSSAAEYDRLVADLVASGVIADAKMAYFEVRPSSHVPTLELRVCDAVPLVDDAVLIAGLFRAAARAAELDIEAGRPARLVPPPLHRAAMWQAARGGLSASLFVEQRHPRPVPAADAARELLARLRPALEEFGDYAFVADALERLLARGTSADRQRTAVRQGGLDAAMRSVIEETQSGLD